MQEKLILIMKKENITNKELSKYLGITEKQFSYKLSGKSDFNCSEMFKFARYFNKSIDDIFLSPMYENGTNKY